MNSSPEYGELFTALVKAQAELKPAKKDSVNPHFRSKFASLASVIESYRKTFAKHGLAVIQRNLPVEGGIKIQTVILHESGEYLGDDGLVIPVEKRDAQAIASATTYARRYGLVTLLNIAADEDDDGNAAAKAPPVRAAQTIRAVSRQQATTGGQ